MIFCHHEHGPSFCKALIAVVSEKSGYLKPDASHKDWGRSSYSILQEDEHRWYTILNQDPTDTVHWYRQLCLDHEVVWHDMQKLSRLVGGERDKGILSFKNTYPVLFDALYSVFGYLPSNSRLCEQSHGMMRNAYTGLIGMAQADAQFLYKANTEYIFREERRDLINAAAAKTNGS